MSFQKQHEAMKTEYASSRDVFYTEYLPTSAPHMQHPVRERFSSEPYEIARNLDDQTREQIPKDYG